MKYRVFLLSLLSLVTVHALLPYGAYQDNDYRYSENEYGNLPPEYWMSPRQPAPQHAGIMSYLPTFLCVALLGYVGYDYIKHYMPTGSYIATQYTPSRPEKMEYAFSSYDGAASHAGQIMIETSIWDQAMSLMSLKNIGLMGTLFLVCYGLNQLAMVWKNPHAKQAVLHQDITHCYGRGHELHQRVCATAQEYGKKGILKEKEAYAIATYATDLTEKLHEYYTDATSAACYFGGYKKEISDGDMAKLARWEYQAQACLAEMGTIEYRMRDESDVRCLGKEMIQTYETRSAELCDDAVEGEVVEAPETPVASQTDTKEGVEVIHKGA